MAGRDRIWWKCRIKKQGARSKKKGNKPNPLTWQEKGVFRRGGSGTAQNTLQLQLADIICKHYATEELKDMSFAYLLALNLDLKQDIPQQAIDTLNYITRTEDYEFNSPPDHPFFNIILDDYGPVWKNILSRPYVPFRDFPGIPSFSFQKVVKGNAQIRYNLNFYLHFHDDDMWLGPSDFLDWIAQYSYTKGFVGYRLCDLMGDLDLIFIEGGKIRFFSYYEYDPNDYQNIQTFDELKKEYKKARELLKESFDKQIKVLEAQNSLDNKG